jgi:hypothetical protein
MWTHSTRRSERSLNARAFAISFMSDKYCDLPVTLYTSAVARSSGAGDAYSRCYGAPAVYACAVTSHNYGRGDAGRCFL